MISIVAGIWQDGMCLRAVPNHSMIERTGNIEMICIPQPGCSRRAQLLRRTTGGMCVYVHEAGAGIEYVHHTLPRQLVCMYT